MGLNAACKFSDLLRKTTQIPQNVAVDTKTLTSRVLAHLDAGRLQKAASIVFDSPLLFPFSLYARFFQICAFNRAIVEARKIENHLGRLCPEPPTFLLNRAIETYGKCGSLGDAKELFDEMPQKDGGSWNAMITACTQGGCPEEAICLFESMHKSGIFANEITFASILGSCATLLVLAFSMQIHGLIVKYGFCENVILKTSLVDIYGKCGIISDACKMFYEIQSPNAISWNVIVRRYLEIGSGKDAIFMFFEIFKTSVLPLTYTFSSALIACSSISALTEGSQIHGMSVKVGFDLDERVVTSLLDMYAKCGDLTSARRIFDQPSSRNLFTWTSIVSAYAMNGRIGEARELFDDMPERNLISWNAMLAGYTRTLQWEEALTFVFHMRQETEGINCRTLRLILNVCSGLSNLQLGKEIHAFAYRSNFFSDIFVGNSLLSMYGKCGNLRSAKVWFREMKNWRDSVSWNALLSSFACHRLSEEAMTMFSDMQWETTPSKYIFGTLLAACANVFGLEQGKQIHGFMVRNGYEIDIVVEGALVDMYSKCRCLEYALKVFRKSGSRDVILWNSMVLGCCYNGNGREVLELLALMEEEGVKPDHVTFQGLLLACISEGLVDLGRKYFDSMSTKYCIIPRLEHYEAMIELYGKHGALNKLEQFLDSMPFDATIPMLTKVFDYCRKHGHLRLEQWAAKRLNESDLSVPFQFEII